MTKLYELTGELKDLQELALSDNDISKALPDTIEALSMEFNDKAVAIVKVAENLTSDTNALDEEIKRLQSRKKAIENKKSSLKEYLRNNMEASGIKKIDCPLFSITLRNGSDKLEILDDSKIPDEYVTPKVEMVVDKRRLLSDLKEGADIDGATIIKGKSSILIK